jgi:hypothetical protein
MFEITKPVNKNGITTRKFNGYIQVKVGIQFIPEHRLVAESILGRQLSNLEVVHHINFDKTDNRPSNLALFESVKAHSHWHRQFNQFGWTRPLYAAIENRRLSNLSRNNGKKDLNTIEYIKQYD